MFKKEKMLSKLQSLKIECDGLKKLMVEFEYCVNEPVWKMAYYGNYIDEEDGRTKYDKMKNDSILYFPKTEGRFPTFNCYKWSEYYGRYINDDDRRVTYLMCVLNFYDLHELERKEFMKPGGLGDSIIEEAVKRQYHPNNFEHWKHEVDL
jgi:hypothetical protein